MNKQKILDDLDRLDNDMDNYMNQNGRLDKNAILINLEYITSRMNPILDSNEIPDAIKSRYLITKAAYEIASDSENQENNSNVQAYFAYINRKKIIDKNGVKNVQQALEHISDAVYSYHLPAIKALNAIDQSTLTYAEKKRFNMILKPMLEQINDAQKYMKAKKETSLTVSIKDWYIHWFSQILFKSNTYPFGISDNIFAIV